METINCPICKSNEYEIFKEIKNRDYNSSNILPKKFISICCKCGLIYQNPCIQQKDMNLIYKQYEDKIFNQNGVTKIENLRRVEKFVQVIKHPKNILEIGCSNGMFLLEMYKHGFQCTGIEPSKSNFNSYMKNNYNKNIIYLNDFFENINISEKYDMIFHYYVLEHSYNPIFFLQKSRDLIASNGLMIFEIPNVESFFLLPFIIDIFPYQHIVHFHMKSLQNLLNLTGWEICNEFDFGTSSKPYGMKIIVKPIKKKKLIKNHYELSKQILKNYFDSLDKNIKLIQKKLEPIIRKASKNKKGIIIFGAGENGQFILENTNLNQQVKDIWFCDSNKNLFGKEIKGIKILSPSEIKNLKFYAIIVASSDYQKDIVCTLETLNIDAKKIITLYGERNNEKIY